MDDDKNRLLNSIGAPLLADLEQAGLTRGKLIELLKAELEANDWRGSPHWECRQRARMDILKLCAYYPRERLEVEDKLNLNVVHYDGFSEEEINKRLETLLDDPVFAEIISQKLGRKKKGEEINPQVKSIEYASKDRQLKAKEEVKAKEENVETPRFQKDTYPRRKTAAEIQSLRRFLDD